MTQIDDREYLGAGKAGLAARHRANPASFILDVVAQLEFVKMDIRDGHDDLALSRVDAVKEMLADAFLGKAQN